MQIELGPCPGPGARSLGVCRPPAPRGPNPPPPLPPSPIGRLGSGFRGFQIELRGPKSRPWGPIQAPRGREWSPGVSFYRSDIHGPTLYKFIGSGNVHGPKPFKFIGFGDIHGPKPEHRRPDPGRPRRNLPGTPGRPAPGGEAGLGAAGV